MNLKHTEEMYFLPGSFIKLRFAYCGLGAGAAPGLKGPKLRKTWTIWNRLQSCKIDIVSLCFDSHFYYFPMNCQWSPSYLWLVRNKNLKTFQIISQVMLFTGSFNYAKPFRRWLRDPLD